MKKKIVRTITYKAVDREQGGESIPGSGQPDRCG